MISPSAITDTPRIASRLFVIIFWDKYSKTAMPKTTPSEGTSFVQKGGRGDGNRTGRRNGAGKGKGKPFDKERWKDKECFNCKKKGHPALACPEADDDDDDKSRSSQAKSVKSKGSRRISRASRKRSPHSYNR
jgi:hypothetical protein